MYSVLLVSLSHLKHRSLSKSLWIHVHMIAIVNCSKRSVNSSYHTSLVTVFTDWHIYEGTDILGMNHVIPSYRLSLFLTITFVHVLRILSDILKIQMDL